MSEKPVRAGDLIKDKELTPCAGPSRHRELVWPSGDGM